MHPTLRTLENIHVGLLSACVGHKVHHIKLLEGDMRQVCALDSARFDFYEEDVTSTAKGAEPGIRDGGNIFL